MKTVKKLSDFMLEDRFALDTYMNYLLNQFQSKGSKKQTSKVS